MKLAGLFVRLVLEFEDEFHQDLCTVLSPGLRGRHARTRWHGRGLAGGSGVGDSFGHCRMLLALLLRSTYREFVLENLAQRTSLNYCTDLTNWRLLFPLILAKVELLDYLYYEGSDVQDQ